MVRALVVHDQESPPTVRLEHLPIAQFPRQGDTRIRILYSSLNYKDGLAITGSGQIIRAELPFVPGIDLVGEVLGTSGDVAVGSLVIGTGWGIGESFWGGYAQQQWVDSSWLVPLPEGLEPEQAMAIGTAGFTAALSVMSLAELGVESSDGDIVVTGASGGVGSFAVHLLATSGFRVVASTGKREAHDYLTALGAATILGRDDLGAGAARPLEKARWAGGIDSVGGKTLEAIIAQTGRHGVVAACGLTGGHRIDTTVFPFILRGVTLAGIDSNTCPPDRRLRAWKLAAERVDRSVLERIYRVVGLSDVPELAREIVDGRVVGRIVVDVNQ